MLVKTGTPADLAGPITASSAERTVLSPPTQTASAPLATTEATASRTAADPSTVASSNSIPSSLHTARAILVAASEFDSDGFQATPTLVRPGASRRAIRKLSATGGIVPSPTMYGRCFLGSSGEMPTPAATGSLTIPKTCARFASRLALATA